MLRSTSCTPALVGSGVALRSTSCIPREVFNVITFQMGPRVMLAAKARLDGDLSVRTACERANALERKLKDRFPEIGWCFMELDIAD